MWIPGEKQLISLGYTSSPPSACRSTPSLKSIKFTPVCLLIMSLADPRWPKWLYHYFQQHSNQLFFLGNPVSKPESDFMRPYSKRHILHKWPSNHFTRPVHYEKRVLSVEFDQNLSDSSTQWCDSCILYSWDGVCVSRSRPLNFNDFGGPKCWNRIVTVL